MNEEGQRIVLEEMVEEFKKKKHAMFEELKNKISEVEINKLKEEVEKLLIEEMKKLIMKKNEELEKVTKEKDADLKKVTQEMNEKLEKVVKEKNEELKKVMNEMNDKLEEERFELEVKEDTCEALVIKEGQSNNEIQEAHKELIKALRDLSGDTSSTIGVKRIGQIDEKPFSKVCKQRFSGENVEWHMLYSKWQNAVTDSTWYPFKLVGAGEEMKEVVDEEDEKLKNLREEWGEEVKNAVKTALVELNEFNPSGQYTVPVLWNFRQERKATLREGIAHMTEKIKALKRKARMSDLRVLRLAMPGIDRISELPEYLITKILLCLPTKESVKTSVLSTRWKNLWLKVPGLDLNCNDFPYEDYEQVEFTNFIDRFLEFNNQLRLQKFKVNYSRHEILGFKDRIGTAINRGIQILDAMGSSSYRRKDDGFMYPYFEFMPLNLFTSKTLVSLKLFFSGLEDPGFVSMPCLKFMSLWKIRWCGTMTLEKLASGCPVLEELILIRDIDEDESVVTRVRSQSLKTFYVPSAYGILCRSRVPHTLLEIDAPGLEYLTLKEDHYDRIVVKNLTSLFMIDLGIKFVVKFGVSFNPEDSSKRNEICDFLTGISSARHMIISQKTVEALDLYSKVGSIPKFKNLSRLQAAFPRPLLPFLPTFLESFPNLKHLILKIALAKDDEMEELKLVNVPQCLVSTLECVEIKELLQWEVEEKIIASYFLENSSVLKKLRVSFNDYPRFASSSDIYEDLDKVTKGSRSCRIIVDDD